MGEMPAPADAMPNQSEELASLLMVTRLTLLSTLIATGSLCALVLRQDISMWRQIQTQSQFVTEAADGQRRILSVVGELQKLGARFPDYSRSVLAAFNLPPVTNSASLQAPSPVTRP